MRVKTVALLVCLFATGATARTSGRRAKLSPTSLTFASQPLGTTSAAQTATLSNTGSSTLTINTIAITGANSGDFAQTNNCGTSLAAGAKCMINVTFTPTATGKRTGTLSVSDNASGSPQRVALTGTGGGGGTGSLSVSPTSLTFPGQPVTTTSPPQTVTVTNSGSGTLTLSSIATTGDFGQTNSCGTSVPAGANCGINVTFTPTVPGPRTGALTISLGGGGGSQTVSLTGTGIGTSGTGPVSLAPASLTFGNQTVNTSSAKQTVMLTNNGPGTLTITSIVASVGFVESDTCSMNVALAAGYSCTISVAFGPTTSGPITGTLTFTDDASNSPQIVPLSGTATDAVGTATAKPTTCPSGGVAGTNTCYNLTISCPDVADITALLKVTTPTNGSVGTVIFGTGGGGGSLYDRQFAYGALAVSTVVNAGFTAAQISFNGLPVGWLSGPGGPRKLACRYATAAQWTYNNIQADTTKPFCATGNSGGSAAIAYALSHYGLDSIFAMVEPTSGPPFGRLDYGCICNQPAKQTPCVAAPLHECYGNDAVNFLDPAYGSSICSSAERTHDTTNQALFYSDSVASADALFSYPKTDVHVVFGGQDSSESPGLGMEWIALITTKNTVECVADAPHALPDVQDGATTIANDLINFCHLQ